jgi:hypothetical protein
MKVLCSLMLTKCQEEAGGEGDETDGHMEAQGADEDHGDQCQGEDLLAVRTSDAGRVEACVFVGVLVAQLAEEGEKHDGQGRKDEVECKAGREQRALGDGEAVFHGDVVHQHAGDGQRGEAAGVGSVDDEGAHEDRVDA